MALKGIKVIEMAGLAPAPFAGMILSDFGANVIRVDRPGAPNIDRIARGKRSIGINLKNPDGMSVIRRMCKSADVLIEPFRPGVMERVGLGPKQLLADNPKLIYARMTGYGQDRIMSPKAGHDINYIAMSGVLSKLGRKGERPHAPVNMLGDFAGGGLICALGVVTALYERSLSGKGQVIDANMVEGSAYVASWLDASKDVLFQGPKGSNMLDGGSAFYDTYETKDKKYISVGALEPAFFRDLLKGLGLEGKEVTQTDDSDSQRELFANIIKTKTRDEWDEVFKDLDACVAPVLTAEEAADHPHNVGSFIRGKVPELQAAPAPNFSRTPGITQARPLPEIGQHTWEILSEFNFKKSEYEDLVRKGTVFQSQNSKL